MAEPTPPAKLTYAAMLAYAVLNLGSMAMMSIGAAIVIAASLFQSGQGSASSSQGGPKAFWRELTHLFRASKPLRAYIYASALLVFACTASLIYAKFAPLTFGFDELPIHWVSDLGKMWYFSFPLFLLVSWRRLNEHQQSRVLRAWIITFGVISAIGVQQFFTGWPLKQENPFLQGLYHPTLLFGHHLSVASIWIFPFFASLELLARPEFRKRLGLNLKFLLPTMACALFVLIFAYSRTLWVGLPIGLTAWSLLRLPKRTALSAAAIFCALAGALICTPLAQERLRNGMGVGDRIELWKANLVFFQDRPILGVGFGKNQGLSYNYFRHLHPGQTDFFIGHAHNIYLELLAGTGLVGFFAWLAWVGLGLGRLIRTRKHSHSLAFAGAALSAWIVFLLNGVTQVNFWEGKVLHQVMWMTGLSLWWCEMKKPPSEQ